MCGCPCHCRSAWHQTNCRRCSCSGSTEPTDCPDCIRLRHAARDARVRRSHAEDDAIATQRAYEDHEASAHRIQPPRAWEPAPAVAVTWSSHEGVSYTFAPAPEDS